MQASAEDKAIEIGMEVEEYALRQLAENPRNFSGRYSPYVMLLEIYENSHQYKKAIDILRRLQQFAPNDPSIISKINELQKLDSTIVTEIPNQKIPIDTTQNN